MDTRRALGETLKQTSVLHRTGQAWKVYVSTVVIWVAAPVAVITGWFADRLSPAVAIALLFSVLVVLVAAIAFPCISVRCPECDAPWYWHALSKKGGGIHRVLRQWGCPSCGSACNGMPAASQNMPANNASLTDASTSPLRAQRGAAKRER